MELPPPLTMREGVALAQWRECIRLQESAAQAHADGYAWAAGEAARSARSAYTTLVWIIPLMTAKERERTGIW